VTTPKIDPELMAKLKALGIDPTSPNPQWVTTQPVNAEDLPSVQHHRDLLAQMRDVLKNQLQEDLAKLEAAHMQLEKLKHGGGT